MFRINASIVAISVATVLLSFSLTFAGEGEGGYAGEFLRMGVGARALAMGGAFTAIADDPTATYWNPAGLAQLRNPQVGAMYSIMSLNRSHNFTSFVQPTGSTGTFGLGWINFGVDKIDGRDSDGNPTGNFGDSQTAFILSYGRTLSTNLSAGGSLKFLYHSLAGRRASGLGWDIGALMKISETISVGAVVQDIASSITWDTDSEHKETFPVNVRAGVAVSPKAKPVSLSIEIENNGRQRAKYHAGLEYWLFNVLGIRIGYNSGGFTAGASLKVPAGTFKIQTDYAFAGQELDGGTNQKMSLTVEF